MATEADPFRTPALNPTQAAAAIVELINARPTSPRPDEIEAIVARVAGAPTLPGVALLSEAQSHLLEAIHECLGAEKVLNAAIDQPSDQYDALNERFSPALDRVDELARQLPWPTRSVADVVLLAQAAFCQFNKTDDGIEPADTVEDAAAVRVVQAVLQFAGIKHH